MLTDVAINANLVEINVITGAALQLESNVSGFRHGDDICARNVNLFPRWDETGDTGDNWRGSERGGRRDET